MKNTKLFRTVFNRINRLKATYKYLYLCKRGFFCSVGCKSKGEDSQESLPFNSNNPVLLIMI